MRVAIKSAYLLCAGKDDEVHCGIGTKGTVILDHEGGGFGAFFGNSRTDMSFYFEDGYPDDWTRVDVPLNAPAFFCPKHKDQAEALRQKLEGKANGKENG